MDKKIFIKGKMQNFYYGKTTKSNVNMYRLYIETSNKGAFIEDLRELYSNKTMIPKFVTEDNNRLIMLKSNFDFPCRLENSSIVQASDVVESGFVVDADVIVEVRLKSDGDSYGMYPIRLDILKSGSKYNMFEQFDRLIGGELNFGKFNK